MSTPNCFVGQVRPSQLLWTYGPGALIDLPNLSVITMGLDYWKRERCTPIKEARLLNEVRRVIGPQVQELLMPPIQKEEMVDFHSAEAFVGVPVKPFPRWLRCVKCGLLAEYDSGLFEIKENLYRPEQTHFVHKNCQHGKNIEAVPARFLIACSHGHIDDFPWRWFVHGGPSDCTGTLHFFERGASLQTENLWVKCDGCGAARSLVHAFGKEGQENLPRCRGRHPHLNKFDECEEVPRAILLGATNGWFPVTLSVLAIPTEDNSIAQLVTDGWDYFNDCESEIELKVVLKTLTKTHALPGIENWDPAVVWKAIEEKKACAGEPVVIKSDDVKIPEWNVLTAPNPPKDWPHFMSTPTPVPRKFADKISNVLLLNRLRKVNALVGYTRIEAANEFAAPDEQVPRAPLAKKAPTWIPACEVHGEGIFIRFDEDALKKWENLPGVKQRDTMLKAGHNGWRIAHNLTPDVGYPGIRYVLLHTIAHLIIREFSLECGYNAASIQERIYASNDSDNPMAGILLYTAASDSDGTLGGLVDLGKANELGRIMELAFRRAEICSSDPLCAQHDPADDRSLHAAACHACAFVAETSCEAGNKFLDRAVVVNTFDCDTAAFFTIGDR